MSSEGPSCLVVHAHPDPDSFSAAIRDRAVAALIRAGHQVEIIDLYRPRYEPAMSEQEHLDYYSNGLDHPDPAARANITAIKQASMLVFIYPTWWSGLPAIMKGWLDRTLLPDVAFTLTGGTSSGTGNQEEGNEEEPSGTVSPALTNITRIVGITTYGSGRGEVLLLGDAGRRTITRTVRLVCARRCRTTWLGLHRLDSCTPGQRAQFLEQVDAKLGALR